MDTIPNFYIDEDFICEVLHQYVPQFIIDEAKSDPQKFMEFLKTKIHYTVTEHKEHPEFLKLRDRLELEGFIEVQRTHYNGDRVLKEFRLNGARFRTGETFYCAAAMKYTINYKLNNPSEE